MFSIPAFLLATALAALVASLAYYYIHAYWRRYAEYCIGNRLLAGLHWRDFAHLVLEALRRQDFLEDSVERQPGDSGFDFVLAKKGERWLLACKHGTNYRLGEQAVREFATTIRMHGAMGGIIATLGEAEGFAREIARTHEIRILDKRSLWPLVAPLAPEPMRQRVQDWAETRVKRMLALAAVPCLALGAGTYYLAADGSAAEAESAISEASIMPRLPPRGSTAAAAGRTDPAPASAPDQSLEKAHRDAVVREIATLAPVNSAAWSTRSTLVVALHSLPEAAGADPAEQACRIVLQYEDLRFTRLQIEPPPGSANPVRWRQCR